jgi:ectoine hydroxylase-related dioxygenase (phytanoyl-CoA dioxygenase family)
MLKTLDTKGNMRFIMRAPRSIFFDVMCRLKPTNAWRELSSEGAIEVPAFLDKDWASEMQRVVSEIYAELAAAREAETPALLENKELEYHFTAWRGVNLKHLPRYLRTRRPDLAVSFDRLVDQIRDQTGTMFGPGWRFIPTKSWFRRHVGVARKVPWHIDADAAAVRGHGNRAFNVWLPLEPVGTDLPSLDVIRGSHTAMRELPLLKPPDIYRDDDFASGKGEAATALLEPGDALIFDQYTLHRTQQAGSDETIRTACEFRFAL